MYQDIFDPISGCGEHKMEWSVPEVELLSETDHPIIQLTPEICCPPFIPVTSAEWRAQSNECTVTSAEWRMQSDECRVTSAEWWVHSDE